MNILDKRSDKSSEKYIQNQVINNLNLQKYVLDNLGIEQSNSIKFTKGLTYANRILPDIKISKGKEILALVECKGAKINVTDYVRGIGQLLQYEFFYEKISPKINLIFIQKILKLYICIQMMLLRTMILIYLILNIQNQLKFFMLI